MTTEPTTQSTERPSYPWPPERMPDARDIIDFIRTRPTAECEVLVGSLLHDVARAMDCLLHHPTIRRCRVCDCTTERACIVTLTDGREGYTTCSWVEPDLCSECVGIPEGASRTAQETI